MRVHPRRHHKPSKTDRWAHCRKCDRPRYNRRSPQRMKLHHDPPGQPTTPLSAKADYPLLPGESHSRWLQRTGWQRKAAATSSRDQASMCKELHILARCGMTATKCAKSNGWAHVVHEKALCGCAPAGPPPGDSGKCQTEGTARRWSAKGEQTFVDQCRRAALGVRREKAALSSGCKSHPATAPAGSNRSRHGGDEMSEAFG